MTGSIGSPWMWGLFSLFVFAMLALDVFCLGGAREHRVSHKEALLWTVFWIVLAMIFNLGVWYFFDGQHALEFFSVYVLEKSLSIDNIFVFILIFSYFAIPLELQRRVLLFGIIGAIFFRAVMILLGSVLIKEFSWVLYIFGAFLIFTGIKMFFVPESDKDLTQHSLLKWVRKHFNVTDQLHHQKFFVRKNKALFITPLFIALIFIEVTDIIFAVDSVPAAFGITTDAFIIFTANIFAILGLRALFFVLVDWKDRFHFLKYGLAAILIFIGLKMLIGSYFDYHLPIAISVGGIVLILAIAIGLSLRFKPGVDSIEKR